MGETLPAEKAALFNRFGGGLVHMGFFEEGPQPMADELVFRKSIRLGDPEMLGHVMAALSLSAATNAAWSLANAARMLPFTIKEPMKLNTFKWCNGGTVSGNADAGIYDRGGIRIASSGSTAIAGADSVQAVRFAGQTLAPGSYFAAMAVDNAVSIFSIMSIANRTIGELYNILGQASAFPLPVQLNFGTTAQLQLPIISLDFRILV
jgi:hypothetical protein